MPTSHARRRFVFGLLLLALAGCAAPPSSPSGGTPSIALELFVRGEGSRFTYFTLDEAGLLSFAGGRNAALREAAPVKTLTAEEQAELWRIIRGHDLLHAKGAGMFKEGDKTTYELKLDTSEGSRELRALDNQLPGVVELHDALFQIQAAVRYNLPGLK